MSQKTNQYSPPSSISQHPISSLPSSQDQLQHNPSGSRWAHTSHALVSSIGPPSTIHSMLQMYFSWFNKYDTLWRYILKILLKYSCRSSWQSIGNSLGLLCPRSAVWWSRCHLFLRLSRQIKPLNKIIGTNSDTVLRVEVILHISNH